MTKILVMKTMMTYANDDDVKDDYDDHAGRHNLRSFLAANSTQNYFLIAHMLSFL